MSFLQTASSFVGSLSIAKSALVNKRRSGFSVSEAHSPTDELENSELSLV